jgi:hypothetical protein
MSRAYRDSLGLHLCMLRPSPESLPRTFAARREITGSWSGSEAPERVGTDDKLVVSCYRKETAMGGMSARVFKNSPSLAQGCGMGRVRFLRAQGARSRDRDVLEGRGSMLIGTVFLGGNKGLGTTE